MEVLLSRDAHKQLGRIPKSDKAKIIKKIRLLRDNPRTGKFLVGEMTGIYSLRAWPYRILYKIEPHLKRVSILKIAHRKDVYRV